MYILIFIYIYKFVSVSSMRGVCGAWDLCVCTRGALESVYMQASRTKSLYVMLCVCLTCHIFTKVHALAGTFVNKTVIEYPQRIYYNGI